MKFFAYWSAVARRAFSESWALIGFERPARIVVAALIYVVYIIIIWNWRGADDATGDVAGTLAGIAAPLIILPVIYLWKFAETPWRMAQEDAAQIVALEKKDDAEVMAPARDMTIGDLFRHIRPDALEKENGEDIWLKVGTEVTQAFIDGTVKVWGRKCSTDQGWNGQSWESIPPHLQIAPDKWACAHFTYQFFAPGTERNCHVRWRAPQTHKEFYFDVRVSRAEAQPVWPCPVEPFRPGLAPG